MQYILIKVSPPQLLPASYPPRSTVFLPVGNKQAAKKQQSRIGQNKQTGKKKPKKKHEKHSNTYQKPQHISKRSVRFKKKCPDKALWDKTCPKYHLVHFVLVIRLRFLTLKYPCLTNDWLL